MADERRHGKGSLLLPSSLFFAEEEDIFPVANNKLFHQNWSSCSDFGSSSLSSPVDSSELGSTESDEGEGDGEYIAELTRQMAHYMLQDDDDDDDDLKHPEGEATLGWSKSHEQVAVMQEIAKLEINEEETAEDKSSPKLSSNSLEPNSFHQTEWINPSTSHSTVDLQSKQALIDAQIRAVQLRLQQQHQQQKGQKQQANRCNQKAAKRQVRKAAVHEKGIASSGGTGKRQQISVAINLPEQQKINNGSDKGEASHGETGPSRLTGSGGTGVFLPRSTSNSTTTESSSAGSRTTESRKKPGCSTVIIPARVAQALKLHFDRVGPTSRSNGATLPLQQAVPTGDLRYVLQPKPKTRSRKTPVLKCQEDIGLPQEWTYDATT